MIKKHRKTNIFVHVGEGFSCFGLLLPELQLAIAYSLPRASKVVFSMSSKKTWDDKINFKRIFMADFILAVFDEGEVAHLKMFDDLINLDTYQPGATKPVELY